jgi:hypothetical protein
MLLEADENKPGTGGKVTLWANDKQIGEGRMSHTVPVMVSSYSGMDVGRDNGFVVDRAYEDKAAYAFTGTVKQSRPCTSTSRCRLSAQQLPIEVQSVERDSSPRRRHLAYGYVAAAVFSQAHGVGHIHYTGMEGNGGTERFQELAR